MRLEDAIRAHQDRLLQLPNVTGIGTGQKDGKPVIKVFVTHKVPDSALQPSEVIPNTLEGYPTDVEEIGVVTAESY
ncbi:MAG: hypothetical protein ACREMY_14520 [bacterium]